MPYNKIEDGSGMVHATQPLWPVPGLLVKTLCAYDVPVANATESTDLMTCTRCGVALIYMQEAAIELDKAITFAREEAKFYDLLDRRMGSPSPWSKLRSHEVRKTHQVAVDLFHQAVAHDLPTETIIRTARRVEAIRLELERSYD